MRFQKFWSQLSQVAPGGKSRLIPRCLGQLSSPGTQALEQKREHSSPRRSGSWFESHGRKQDKKSCGTVYTMRVGKKLPDYTDRHHYHCKGIREHTGGTLPYLATESQVSGT